MSIKRKNPNNWNCECGKVNTFDAYVAAHWQDKLVHVCECGRKHQVWQGKITLLKDKKHAPK